MTIDEIIESGHSFIADADQYSVKKKKKKRKIFPPTISFHIAIVFEPFKIGTFTPEVSDCFHVFINVLSTHPDKAMMGDGYVSGN